MACMVQSITNLFGKECLELIHMVVCIAIPGISVVLRNLDKKDKKNTLVSTSNQEIYYIKRRLGFGKSLHAYYVY